MKKLLNVMLLAILGLTLVACSKAKDTAVVAKQEAAATTAKAIDETKEAMQDVADEVEAVVDASSDETYVAGFVAGALKSLNDSAECKGVRDTVANVLTQYKEGGVAEAAAIEMVKETVAAQKSCMQ